MVRVRPDMPAGHGEVVAVPPVAEWPALMARNAELRATWEFEVAGDRAAALVALARDDMRLSAVAFSQRLGIAVAAPGGPDQPIVMTGHQPELYHPGVWVKDFLVQRLTRETGALGIDIVVDTDAFDTLRIEAPCMQPDVQRCREYLALGGPETCYACSPTLSGPDVDEFSDSVLTMLRTLPAPSVSTHYEGFARALRSAADDAANLAELITFARRRYEASAGTDYLELPVTSMVRGRGFRLFAADILTRAREFAEAFDGELASYRTRAGVRNAAQPFPDLRRRDDLLEVPFWLVHEDRRESAWVRCDDTGVSLCDGEGSVLADLPAGAGEAADVIGGLQGVLLAPRAVTLTLFARMFLADLFIHGIGGARYDAVTDAVAARWYGVEPPPFVTASMTLYLPLGIHAVTDEEVAAAHDDVNRLKHNPDQMLSRIDFDDAAERRRAELLVDEKRSLVDAIAVPDADKKALGGRIRMVNEQLSALLEPLRAELEARQERLVAEQAAADILTDRTYPFCFWSPAEVADKVT